jgi:3-methyladenine DNA glycosylase AlkC
MSRSEVTVEEIKDLIQDIQCLEFEFPGSKLNPLYETIKEKIDTALKAKASIYVMENLIWCLNQINAPPHKAG